MTYVKIDIKNNDLIKEFNTTYWSGYFGGYLKYNDVTYRHHNINELFKEEHFSMDFLNEGIGEFVLILASKSTCIAIVDRKRSIPLFYYKNVDRWILTDKLGEVNDELHPTAVKEFILTGFTANEKTLYKDVYQIEAGSSIKFTPDGQYTSNTYYQYYHDPVERDLEQLSKEMQDIMMQVFSDLAKRLRNKTAFLPLSGGYDSRIIALLLKEFGVENIHSFTYGKGGNKEALISKEIANKLGLKWDFIEYKKDNWHKWYHSEEWNKYVDFSVNGSSMAHLQDWPAVTQLMHQYPDQDFVFIPGHSGDFIAGSHLSYEITVDREFSKEELIQFITQKHHKLWEISGGLLTSGTDLLAEIEKSLGTLKYQTNEEASAAFEYWDWKERQAKFIINSLRVYEFYQQEWDIPLWDDRLMNFFTSVPVQYRFQKYLYDYTLHKMFPDYFNEPNKQVAENASLKQKYGPLYQTAKKIYNQKKLLQQYYTDPMEWYGIYKSYPEYLAQLSFKMQQEKYKQPYNINSFLVKDYILNMKGDSK